MCSKICKKCLVEKELTNFKKGNDPKDGLKYNCNECQKNIDKLYRDNNKDKYKTWVKNNPNKIKEKSKRQYNKNKNKIKTTSDKLKIKNKRAKYYLENKNSILKSNKKYSIQNKIEISKRHEQYRKTGKTKEYRNKTKHIVAWRSMLNNTLKRLSQPKEDKTINLLKYSPIDLHNHLESLFTDGMSWDNHGDWHIDHIKGVINFDKDTHPSIVNALSNLRPLWATTREINGVIYEGNLNRVKHQLFFNSVI